MNHIRNHYVIGALAVALAAAGTGYVSHRVDALPAARVQHFAWPGMSQEQEDRLQAGFTALGKQDVTIWCLTANCSDLAEDMQYVAYLAGWDTHSDIPIAGSGTGLRVSPDDATGKAIAAAIEAGTGIKTDTEPGPTVNGRPIQPAGTYNIIIGAK